MIYMMLQEFISTSISDSLYHGYSDLAHTFFLFFIFLFRFVPMYSTLLVTLNNKYTQAHNYREKPHGETHTSNDLLGERETFGEKEMERDRGSDCISCAKHRHAARRHLFEIEFA